jgi:hypothetical protein
MKNFRDYLKESEQAADTPVAGDTFAINIREECLIESVVVESRDDGVVIAADERMMSLLERYGYTFEENCMECGMMECGCSQGSEEYDNETDAGQDPGEYDLEGDMAKDELMTMIRSARKLIGMLDNDDNMPEWTQKKINKATDYVDTASDYISSKKERGVMEQSQEGSPVASAVLHRIMMAHPGLLAQHGPEKVMDAVDELAYHVGDVEEIGTSDVSGWVREVITMLASADLEPINDVDELEEGPNDGKEDNFTIDDIKNLERIRDLETLKAQAKELIKGKPARRMKPEKISWFYNHIDTLKNPLAVIKMMYDLMLAGEGNKVIGSRNSMSSNSYRSKFGEQDVSEDNLDEAEYQGRKVPLGKPMKGDVAKSKVYVKDPKTGNVKKVNFGDPNMKIKKSNPARRKSFRARHNCDNPGPRTKARYWSCRAW